MTTPNVVVGVRIPTSIMDSMNILLDAGLYFSPSEFIRDACRRLCSRYRVLKFNDLDYPTPYKTNEEIELQEKLHEVVKALREARERREQLFTSEL